MKEIHIKQKITMTKSKLKQESVTQSYTKTKREKRDRMINHVQNDRSKNKGRGGDRNIPKSTPDL